MFNRFREIYELKKKADDVKKKMEAVHLDFEDRGVNLKIRGDNHFEEILIDGQKDERIREVLNKALKEMQKKVAKKMQGDLGDLGIPGLK